MKYEQPIIEILRIGHEDEDIVCLSGCEGGDNEGEFINFNINNLEL